MTASEGRVAAAGSTGAAPRHPLLLGPIYKGKVWGGRAFERLGRHLPGADSTRWGESWEVADLERTSRSGGGGEGAHSPIENGPISGDTLDALVRRWPTEILGSVRPAEDGGFPLLVKYLDARENLSVQVHPSPDYAARHHRARLKSEAWYVVDADEGSVLYLGLREGTTLAEVEQAVRAGAVTELMIRVPATPGSCHYLPSGLCHALGGGVLVAEVQNPSDTTFRLDDWGRQDRELHVAEALEAMDVVLRPHSVPPSGGAMSSAPSRTPERAAEPPGVAPERAEASSEGSGDGGAYSTHRVLVRTADFGIDECRLQPGATARIAVSGPEVWMAVEGAVTLASVAGQWPDVVVPGGRTTLIPASAGGIVATSRTDALLLRVTLAG